MSKPTAILANRLYVPDTEVTSFHKKHYTYVLNQDLEETDPEYMTTIETFKQVQDTIAFQRGDLSKIKTVFDEFEIEDQRAIVPVEYKISWIGKVDPKNPEQRLSLSAEQKSTVAEWIKHGYGMIEAPPRWGKTVSSLYLLHKLKQKTLILASTIDLLNQWEKELREWTDITEVEKHTKTKLAGILWKWTDVFPLFTLTTWQAFISDSGQKFIKDNRDTWGAVLVDEAHQAAANFYSQVVSKTNPIYRIGVTATPERKDQLHCIIDDVIGPVVAKGITESMQVQITNVYTGHKVKNFVAWTTFISRLVEDDDRNELIAKRIVEDFNAGRNILVTSDRVTHLYRLADLIHNLSDEAWDACDVLCGATKNREQLLDDARSGKIRIVLGMNKIVQTGINVPMWDCLHNTLPMSNKPNWYQRVSRIRTKMEGKPMPIVRDYLDKGHGIVYATKATRDSVNKELGFIMPDVDKEEEPKAKKLWAGVKLPDAEPDLNDMG